MLASRVPALVRSHRPAAAHQGAGIFARLYYRDGKPGYLKDLPRVLRYTREAAAAYAETAPFADFIAQRIEGEFALRRSARSREFASRAVARAPRAAMILAAGRGERCGR
jgi:hypothetical protein